MPMTNADFKELIQNRRLDEDLLLSIKGQDYARADKDNRLRNFELIADLLAGAPMDAVTVCAIYWLKHVLAICTYVATRKLESEDLDSRFTDNQNYGYLLEACVASQEEAKRVPRSPDLIDRRTVYGAYSYPDPEDPVPPNYYDDPLPTIFDDDFFDYFPEEVY